MLSQNTINEMAKFLKVKPEDLKTAINATDEQDIAIPELSVFTKDELQTRDSNLSKQSYNEGKTAGVEMLVKEQKEKLGLEFDGKDVESLVSSIQKKAVTDAKVSPDAKVKELTESITNLQNNLKVEQGKVATLEGQITASKQEQEILSLFPSNTTEALTKTEIYGLMKGKYEFVKEDGKLVAKENGQIVKNATTQAPVEVSEVIKSYLTERNWITADTGRQGRGGAGDSGSPSVFSKLSEVEAKFKSEGKSLNGGEYSAAVEAAAKANPHFDMNS